MEIRTKLWLNTAVTVIVALVIGLVLIILDREAMRLRGQTEGVRAVAQALFRLDNLTLDYLLHPGQRDLTQWNITHEGTKKILSTIAPESDEERVLMKSLMNDYENIKALFAHLVALEESSPQAQGQQILAGQLLLKTQAMISGASQLEHLGDQRLMGVRRLSSLAIIGLISGLAAMLAVTGFRLASGIMGPLQRLIDGAEKVGKGDLEYRIGMKTQDEMGEVARRFDLMTENLSRQRAHQRETDAELRRLNEELEQRVTARTAQLQDANKELEAFAYSVSHDLRTPLRAVDGFSRILLEDYAGTLDGEGKRLLNVVRDNTVKMAQLIDDMLQLSRSGRREMALADVDMEQLAREIVEELKPAAEGRDVRIDIVTLPAVRGDRALLHQVLSNLIANAIKFTRRCASAVIEVGGRSEGGEQVYFVKDNGAGFDMQYVEKLFGVFQRLHTTEEFEGTGIGLAIVKRIVTRHGGRVWAESKLNEGSIFYFALPAKEVSHA
jgi:signal transduction histidine kinase